MFLCNIIYACGVFYGLVEYSTCLLSILHACWVFYMLVEYSTSFLYPELYITMQSIGISLSSSIYPTMFGWWSRLYWQSRTLNMSCFSCFALCWFNVIMKVVGLAIKFYLYIIHISPKGNITINTIAVGNIFNYYYYYYLFYNND